MSICVRDAVNVKMCVCVYIGTDVCVYNECCAHICVEVLEGSHPNGPPARVDEPGEAEH